jgi:hypothetical protein
MSAALQKRDAACQISFAPRRGSAAQSSLLVARHRLSGSGAAEGN